MLRAGADALVEDVPVPELAVAAKVELTCADAADGHADLLKVRASIDRPFAALKERFHPFRAELLIRGDQPVEILARERPGHDRPPQHGQPGCRQRRSLKEAATAWQQLAGKLPGKFRLGVHRLLLSTDPHSLLPTDQAG